MANLNVAWLGAYIDVLQTVKELGAKGVKVIVHQLGNTPLRQNSCRLKF